MRAPFLQTLKQFRRSSTRADQLPQRFLLLCRCGQALQGDRQPRFLSVNCPACGRTVFIAARSPWPRPTSLPTPHADPASQTVVAGTPADRIELRSWRLPDAAVGLSRLRAILLHVVSRLVPPRRWFTLPRLATALVALLLIATLAWSAHRRNLAHYRAQIETSLAAGRTSLAEADFSSALPHLEVADHAARGLRLATPSAREAVQLLREVRLWTRLDTEPLDPFVASLPAHPTPQQVADAARRFARLHVGRTLIFDGWLHRESVWRDAPQPTSPPDRDHQQGRGDPQKGKLLLDFPALAWAPPLPPAAPARPEPQLRFDWSLLAPDARFELVLPDVPCFEHVKASAPTRVVFGAEIAALTYSPAPQPTWQLRLVPASCTLLTTPGPLFRQGWPDDEQLQLTLQAQFTLATRAP